MKRPDLYFQKIERLVTEFYIFLEFPYVFHDFVDFQCKISEIT